MPVQADGDLILYHSGPRAERYVPAWKLLDPGFDASQLAGSILLMGATAQGLRDFKPTPLNPAAAGIEIHAQLVEQIIAGQFLRRPTGPRAPRSSVSPSPASS